MPLSPGDRIGPYTITAAIGRGGMGEVFRARDPRLNRDVAIKVLPELFAADPERLARFEREAQVLAALNHPNIAHVHGLEESSGIRALVMELVEGRTLADVIGATGGRGVPVIDALPIARQIAEALDVAHEKGIVHRDLKPANILVTADGAVKVLDFGLAKALEAAPGDTNLMNSPTFTGAMTGAGVVLGTAAYMSPEQARGQAVDRRADIWAFGVVVYELLTGRQVFEGATATDIVAAVITREPDWDRLPPTLPEALVRVLHRCLEKDPKRRMRDIGDARAEIEAASAQYSTPQGAPAAGMAQRQRSVRPWAWSAGIALALVAGAAIGRYLLAPVPAPSTPVRFEIILPEGSRAVISPDGARLALTSSKGLLIRDLDRLENRLLPGTEGAESPFWAGDSSTVMYGAKGKLWRVTVAGGAPTPICTLPGGSWDQDAGGVLTADGSIVFTNGSSPLLRVPAAGGDISTVVPTNAAEDLHFHNASGLPNEKGILFVTHRKRAADTIELWTGTERRQVLRLEGSPVSHPVYSHTGHVLFTRGGTNASLWAVPFSLTTLAVTGQPFLVDQVATAATVSRTMRLAYVPAASLPPSRLTWFDRQGRQTGRLEELHVFDRFVALSPDGARAAVAERTEDQWDVWAVDLKTGGRTRLTVDGFARNPVWTPDGRSVIYTSIPPNGAPTLKRAAADGSGLLEDIGPGRDASVTTDGRLVFYWRDFDLFHRPLGAGGAETPFLTGPNYDVVPKASPDGRFVAFLKMDAKTFERTLFVKPFAGGGDPVGLNATTYAYCWSHDGRLLFFAHQDAIMEVDVQTVPRFRVGVPRKLFSVRPLGTSGAYPAFDVSADGQRFLTVQAEPEASIQRVVVVLDFKPDSVR